MKNRKLLLIVSMALAMMMSLGGTLAYLTDTDGDVNVMVVGNVKIEQIEQERDENGKLVDFTQKKPALPAVGPVEWAEEKLTVDNGQYRVFTDELKNVIDKIVTVKNTGKSDAYVRTIVAIEAPDYDPKDLIHLNYNGNGVTQSDPYMVEIDETKYVAFVYTYAEKLGAGETSVPSLMQLFLDSDTTNEDVAAYGDTWEVLVLSQAAQADGFEAVKDADGEVTKTAAQNALDTAFGEVTKENLKTWFGDWETWGKTTVESNEELAAAIEAGETEIVLKAGTYHMPAAAKGKTLTLRGAGADETTIEVVPAHPGTGEANGQLDYNLDGSTVTFNNLTIKTNSELYAGFARMSGTYNNCVIQNTYNLGLNTVNEFNNCEINITNEYLRTNGAKSVVFNGCTFNTDGRAILVFQDGSSVDQTVTVKDCTFNATATATAYGGIHVAAVSCDASNNTTSGTFVVNFEGNNIVDSDFAGLVQIKGDKTPSVITIKGAQPTELTYNQQ